MMTTREQSSRRYSNVAKVLGFLALLLACPVSSLARAEDWKTVLSRVARDAVVKAIGDQTIAFDEPLVSGTLKAIEPEKNVSVTITDLVLKPKKVVLGVSASGRFQADAKILGEGGNESSTLAVQLTLSTSANAEADISQAGTVLVLTPRILGLNSSVEIEEMIPDPGKLVTQLLSQLLKQRVEAKRKELFEHLQQELKSVQLDYGKRISEAIRQELSGHHSEDTAWYNETKEGKMETKTWLWLDDPASSLTIDVPEFELKDDSIGFAIEAKSAVKGKAWGKIRGLLKGDAKMSGKLSVLIGGQLRFGADSAPTVAITSVDAKVNELRFNNDLLDALKGLIEDCVNAYFQKGKQRWGTDIEKAIAKELPSD